MELAATSIRAEQPGCLVVLPISVESVSLSGAFLRLERVHPCRAGNHSDSVSLVSRTIRLVTPLIRLVRNLSRGGTCFIPFSLVEQCEYRRRNPNFDVRVVHRHENWFLQHPFVEIRPRMDEFQHRLVVGSIHALS